MELIHYFYAMMGAAGFGIAVVLFLLAKIKSIKVEHPKAARIALAIKSGAMTFLQEEYKIIAIVVAIVALLIGFVTNIYAALFFIFGSILSMATGIIGMRAATDANVRTTMAAKDEGEHAAFTDSIFWWWGHGLCGGKLWPFRNGNFILSICLSS